MANRYWVGNTGNWSDTAHWSATTGGASGASVPTSADSVYFDANSLTSTGQTVTVNVAANCLDMDWTGALNSPTLTGTQIISVYGNFTTISSMSLSNTNGLRFAATTTGKTITTNGLTLNTYVIFDGVGGGWTLQDNFVITNNLNLNNGAINTGNKNINCQLFNTNNTTTTRSITFGSSTITCSNTWQTNITTGLALNMGTSTIILTGNTTSFAGGGLTYNNVEFQGTLITITGSNTFNILTIDAGKTVNFTAGTTQTVTSLVANGTSLSIITMQSVTAGTPANINKSSGEAFIRHCSLKDIAGIGGALFTDLGGTNVSGNSGWTFPTQRLVANMGLATPTKAGFFEGITSANTDISIGGTTSKPSLTINTGTSANQLSKRDANGNIPNNGLQIVSKSANATLLLTETGIIDVTTAASTITITLPSAVTTQVSYIIKKSDSGAGTITIATTSSQLIDGVSTKSISGQYSFLEVVSDGTGWQILDGNSADLTVDGTTNKAYTATEKTKLAGIATGATANQGTVTSITSPNSDIAIGGTSAIPTVTANTGQSANQLAKRDANGNIPNNGNQSIALSVSTTLTPAQSGIIKVTTAASTITITLPTAATSQLVYTIKKVDSGAGTVLINTTSSQTLDGVLTKTLTNQYASIILVSDGSNWIVESDDYYDKIGILSVLPTTAKSDLVSSITETWNNPTSNTLRQALINSNMDVAQQGTSFTNPANNSYTLDMWVNLFTNTGTLPTTITHTQNTLTAGELFNSYFSYQVNVNGAGSGFGVSDAYGQAQRIEYGTRVLCGNGKKVTISIEAKSSIASKRIAIGLKQVYGTGGSPSAAEILTPTATSIRTLSSTMSQYTFTFTTNTLTGKTFGTNNDDYLELCIYEMWGATFAANNFGGGTAETFVGAGNINFSQVVLNSGDVALPYQPKSINDELLACQRYFEKSYAYTSPPANPSDSGGVQTALVPSNTIVAGQKYGTIRFSVKKRTTPTIIIYPFTTPSNTGRVSSDGGADLGVNSGGVGWQNDSSFIPYNNSGGTLTTTTNTIIFHWTADTRL